MSTAQSNALAVILTANAVDSLSRSRSRSRDQGLDFGIDI
jgi:hypothetical protein